MQAARGTPCYMAPELFSDGAAHSTASDLWALGCVLYECSMGRPPFLNSSLNQLIQDILHAEPQPIPGAQRSIRGTAMRTLRVCVGTADAACHAPAAAAA